MTGTDGPDPNRRTPGRGPETNGSCTCNPTWSRRDPGSVGLRVPCRVKSRGVWTQNERKIRNIGKRKENDVTYLGDEVYFCHYCP